MHSIKSYNFLQSSDIACIFSCQVLNYICKTQIFTFNFFVYIFENIYFKEVIYNFLIVVRSKTETVSYTALTNHCFELLLSALLPHAYALIGPFWWCGRLSQSESKRFFLHSTVFPHAIITHTHLTLITINLHCILLQPLDHILFCMLSGRALR